MKSKRRRNVFDRRNRRREREEKSERNPASEKRFEHQVHRFFGCSEGILTVRLEATKLDSFATLRVGGDWVKSCSEAIAHAIFDVSELDFSSRIF